MRHNVYTQKYHGYANISRYLEYVHKSGTKNDTLFSSTCILVQVIPVNDTRDIPKNDMPP